MPMLGMENYNLYRVVNTPRNRQSQNAVIVRPSFGVAPNEKIVRQFARSTVRSKFDGSRRRGDGGQAAVQA